MSWSFDLPKLCRVEHLTALEELIKGQQLEVVIIDPLYLSLLSAETAGSGGQPLRDGCRPGAVVQAGAGDRGDRHPLAPFQEVGHPRRRQPRRAGGAEPERGSRVARQWILLQRRTPYNSDGIHDLWLRAGGSAGHSSLVAVTVEEGLIDPDTGSGRHWRVVVSNRARRSPMTS